MDGVDPGYWNIRKMTESNSLVPSLLNSIEVKHGKTRPSVQAHPQWELMRVTPQKIYIHFYCNICCLGFKRSYRLGKKFSRRRRQQMVRIRISRSDHKNLGFSQWQLEIDAYRAHFYGEGFSRVSQVAVPFFSWRG